jgi:hypothetical protein
LGTCSKARQHYHAYGYQHYGILKSHIQDKKLDKKEHGLAPDDDDGWPSDDELPDWSIYVHLVTPQPGKFPANDDLDWKEGHKKLASANVKDQNATNKSADISPHTLMVGDKMDDLTQMILRVSGAAAHAPPARTRHTFRFKRGKREHDVNVRMDQETRTMGDVVDSAGNEFKVFSVPSNHKKAIESKTEAKCFKLVSANGIQYTEAVFRATSVSQLVEYSKDLPFVIEVVYKPIYNTDDEEEEEEEEN